MRKLALIAGIVGSAFVYGHSSHTSAQSLDLLQVNNTIDSSIVQRLHNDPALTASIAISPDIKPAMPADPTPPPPPDPTYTVVQGDNLSTIAKANNTTVDRLYAKNTNVNNPDVIDVGTVLTIPTADEQLPERPLPASPAPTPVDTAAPRAQTTVKQAAVIDRGSSSGNTYTPGYCTWYAKNRRPDLPNNLGNAISWVSRAAAQGIPTGSMPRAGAIGQAGDHVVYIESVNPDGTVNISEMNYQGLFVVSHRTAPGNSFSYIY